MRTARNRLQALFLLLIYLLVFQQEHRGRKKRVGAFKGETLLANPGLTFVSLSTRPRSFNWKMPVPRASPSQKAELPEELIRGRETWHSACSVLLSVGITQ